MQGRLSPPNTLEQVLPPLPLLFPLPSLPLLLEADFNVLQLGGLGERFSSPAGLDRARPPNGIW